jgi:hypothetical protein
MFRIRSIVFSLLLALPATSPVFGQDEHYMPPEFAVKYSMADAIVSSSNFDVLQLSPEQQAEIKEMNAAYSAQVNALIDATWGIGPGDIIDSNNLPANQPPEFKQMLAKERKKFEEDLFERLLPFQIHLAELAVLQKRMKRGGVLALVHSTDLPIVKELDFEAPPAAIVKRMESAKEKASEEILDLQKELDQVIKEFKEKAAKIRKREFEEALSDLGKDGDRIRVLMSQASEIENW